MQETTFGDKSWKEYQVGRMNMEVTVESLEKRKNDFYTLIVENKICEVVARVADAVNAAYCAAIGDTVILWEDMTDAKRLGCIKAVEAILDNPQLSPEQLHEMWMDTHLADGWVYGEKKSTKEKTHPNLVPYEQLSEKQRMKDSLFHSVVVAMLGGFQEIAERPA